MMEPVKRRAPIEHIFDILRNARQPIKKTRLLYAANLSAQTFYKYVPLLLEKDLIEEVPYTRVVGFGRKRRPPRTKCLYATTDKGKALIDLIERAHDILGWSDQVT